MSAEEMTRISTVLGSAQSTLNALATSSETEIVGVSQGFRRLAAQVDAVLQQTSAIVRCVEDESMAAVLSKMQSLCVSVKPLLAKRVAAATVIQSTLRAEERLLGQLTLIARHQQGIAFHLKALSVLTDVEVAHLGDAGGAFQILSHELSSFSKSLAEQTRELSSRTGNCEHTVKQIRLELITNLPLLESELKRIEEEIGRTLQVIDASVARLGEVPARFRACAEKASQQITGVVAAIQAHDITRQQTAHVRHALFLIASNLPDSNAIHDDRLPAAYGGLLIQCHQLQAIAEVGASWTSQIDGCVDGIQQLSAAELMEIAPAVVRQESELSTQLGHIELLQQKSQDYGARIQDALQGVATLLELVQEQLQRSENIRRRLQLLMLNSYVEADRLGQRGLAVSSIANLIKELFADWNLITERSHAALSEIQTHTGRMNEWTEVFSDSSCRDLRADQAQTRTALQALRDAVAFVDGEAAKMQSATQRLQMEVAGVKIIGDRLKTSFRGLDAARIRVLEAIHELEKSDSEIAKRYDGADVERQFSEFYTTEREREVMRAALCGMPLPAQKVALGGNGVELF